MSDCKVIVSDPTMRIVSHENSYQSSFTIPEHVTERRRGIDRRSVLRSIGAGTLGAAGATVTSGSATADESEDHYHNPVGPIGFGDVSIIQADDGTYYAYGTETPYDIVPIAKCDDMVSWEYFTQALQNYPDWRDNEDAGIWAPDVNYYDGQYHLYYSYSTWGSQNNPGIGLATADSPEGPFEDQGPVFRGEDLGMTNCIDGDFRVVDGTPYMVWGSWYGIHGVELTDAADDYVEGTTFHLAGDMREGPMTIRENGYYYLFYSTGHCCDGYDSTYEVEVGRAEEFTGPYYNQNGTDLRELNEHRSGVAVLSGTDRFTGPGHNGAIQDENGDWWMLYHVEATEADETRYMMMDRIQWDENDWPVIGCNGHPSAESPVPGADSYDCDGEQFETSLSTGTATATPRGDSGGTPEPTVSAASPTTTAESGAPADESIETMEDSRSSAETATTSETGDGMSILATVAALGGTAAGALARHDTSDGD